MPRLEKFSENALKALSSRNRMIEGEGSVDEEAPEQRGFRAGGRERMTIKKVPSSFKYEEY